MDWKTQEQPLAQRLLVSFWSIVVLPIRGDRTIFIILIKIVLRCSYGYVNETINGWSKTDIVLRTINWNGSFYEQWSGMIFFIHKSHVKVTTWYIDRTIHVLIVCVCVWMRNWKFHPRLRFKCWGFDRMDFSSCIRVLLLKFLLLETWPGSAFAFGEGIGMVPSSPKFWWTLILRRTLS